jgi:hypothetical protein
VQFSFKAVLIIALAITGLAREVPVKLVRVINISRPSHKIYHVASPRLSWENLRHNWEKMTKLTEKVHVLIDGIALDAKKD